MICKRFRKVISIFLLVSVLVNSSFNIIIPVYGAEPTEFGDIQVFMPDAPVIGNTETISSSTIAVPDFPMQNIMPRTIFPAQYNLERNWQTPVKDQGRTNLCWAYASIDAIEASTYKNTGTMMNFSVRHLAHATSSHGGNVAGFNRSPGAAGYPTMVMSYAMRGMLHGMVLHVDDPMPNAPTGLAARPVAQTAAIPAGYHVPSSYQLTNLNMSQAVRNARIKQGVMEFGAVAIVQRAPSGRGFNPIHNTWNSGSTSTNHVVTVVGWDANFSGDLFNTRPQGDGAWLVKNTWGDWWGDNGYFWMSFYDFIGGAYVFSPVTSFPTDIANIYEFDIPGTHGWVTPIFHMANVFTAENPNEILTSVRIFNNLVGERVDIFFIPDFDSVNLLNGVSQGWLSPVYSFTATRAGFHNIELPLHVQAAVGNRFALVTSSSTGRMPMASNNLGGETYQFFNGSWAPSRFAASVKGVTGMPAEGVLSYRIVGSGITRFNSLEVGYTDAALQTRTVSVTNVGTGTVTLEQPNQLVNFTLGSLSETVLAPGEVATFTVRPNLGLGVGSYSENILISGSNFTNAMIPVGITILQNSQLTGHGVTIVGEPDFGARRQGAATPVHTFHVTNHSGVTRNVWAMFRGPNPYFIVSGIQQGAANSVSGVPNTPNGGTLTFNVQPRAGLPPGTYIEEIPIAVNLTFASLLTITITARFTVYPNGEASAISISATGEGATASSLNFPGIIFGEPSLNSREITVSNIGDIAVTLEQPSFINFNAGLLSNSELRPGESSTFMLYPRSGLNAGIYIEPITVVGSGEAKASILADFSVLGVSPLTGHGVTITGETDFGVQLQGETPPVHAFTLQNHSGANRNAWAPFRSTNSRFIVSGIPQQATANAGVSGIPGIANNGTLTFSIQPRPNLPPGIYAEIVPIAVNTAAIPLTLFIRVQFTVTDNNASTLSVSPSILDFGDIVHGQVENVSYQTVTVRNISTNTVALENKSASANFEFGDFSTNTLAPGDSATFTVRPRQDIAGGSHNETIVISGTGGAQGTFQIRANLETV
ncbi:MAG: lectin like domain-containing protein, partial [Defluviitaleaceae bacterium]|nr:lectin like domain-containing protein [Defluviitaleaceae bacterium]